MEIKGHLQFAEAAGSVNAPNDSVFRLGSSFYTKLGGITSKLEQSPTYKYITIDDSFPDADNGPTQGLVGFMPTADFDPDTKQHIYFSFAIPDDADLTEDMRLEHRYTVDSTELGSISLVMEANVIGSGDEITPASNQIIASETISAVGSAEEFDVQLLNDLIIPAGSLTQSGDDIQVKFSRDAAEAGDTHTGTYQLGLIRMRYKVD